MKISTVVVWLSVLLFLGCASSQKREGDSRVGGSKGVPVERWTLFEASDFSTSIQDARYGRAVFVRGSRLERDTAVNIFVNGEYLGSLLSNGAASVLLCAGENRLLASYTDVKKQYLHKPQGGVLHTVKGGAVQYFLVVQGQQGGLQLKPITRKAFDAMGARRQRHTLSRVEKQRDCMGK